MVVWYHLSNSLYTRRTHHENGRIGDWPGGRDKFLRKASRALVAAVCLLATGLLPGANALATGPHEDLPKGDQELAAARKN